MVLFEGLTLKGVKMPVGKKVGTGLMAYGRDVLAILVNGILSGTLREIGSIAGFFICPYIAGTQEGKTFNKYLALLLFSDSFLERFIPKGVVG
jgi:hypothetical protein